MKCYPVQNYCIETKNSIQNNKRSNPAFGARIVGDYFPGKFSLNLLARLSKDTSEYTYRTWYVEAWHKTVKLGKNSPGYRSVLEKWESLEKHIWKPYGDYSVSIDLDDLISDILKNMKNPEGNISSKLSMRRQYTNDINLELYRKGLPLLDEKYKNSIVEILNKQYKKEVSGNYLDFIIGIEESGKLNFFKFREGNQEDSTIIYNAIKNHRFPKHKFGYEEFPVYYSTRKQKFDIPCD